jgi:hypothetical protein
VEVPELVSTGEVLPELGQDYDNDVRCSVKTERTFVVSVTPISGKILLLLKGIFQQSENKPLNLTLY